MEVNIAGSGYVAVKCDKLEVNIAGIGDVCYIGKPQIDVSQIRSGSVYNCERD